MVQVSRLNLAVSSWRSSASRRSSVFVSIGWSSVDWLMSSTVGTSFRAADGTKVPFGRVPRPEPALGQAVGTRQTRVVPDGLPGCSANAPPSLAALAAMLPIPWPFGVS